MPSRTTAVLESEAPSRLITPPPPPKESLAYRINDATRDAHTELNQLITTRLPLALPPLTTTPLLYLHGLHIFQTIFAAFESSWQDLIVAQLEQSVSQTNATGPSTPPTDPPSHDAQHKAQVTAYLTTLISSRLWRTDRIEADISYLKALTSAGLPDLSLSADLQRLQADISASTTAKPHVLLAYAWVMYMAIFSGGRWIRTQLRAAGPVFWGHAPAPADDAASEPDEFTAPTTDPAGLELFAFLSPDDGLDVKAHFKAQFARADALLSPAEADEVVAEARRVFGACAALVRLLDAALGSEERLAAAEAAGRARRRLMGRVEAGSLGDRMSVYLPRGGGPNPQSLPGSYMTEGLGLGSVLAAAVLGVAVWVAMMWSGVIGQRSGLWV